MTLRLVRLECLRITRSPALVAALVVWTAAAAAALYNGERVIERQRRVLAQSDALQQAQHEAVLSHQPGSAPAGDQLYYLAFHTRHQPSSWAALSLGQRDQRSFNLKVRMLALHGQLYDGDLISPLVSAFGSFDLTFVLAALAPLLIVALCHDLVSGEREGGTWRLVRAQPVPALRVLAVKAGVRAAVVMGVVGAVIAALPVASAVPWDARVAALIAVISVHLLAWAVLACVVATFGWASEINALVLLALWVVLVVVGPALLLVAGAARFPTPEALELTVLQRQGYHGAWDRPVPETMAAFVARYPEWKDAHVPGDRYSNAWYYAMQQRGDDAAAPAAAAYRTALLERHAWSGRWLALLPPAQVQAAMDRVARTDLPGHIAYLDSVATFHEALKRRFFPVVFAESTVSQVAWRDVPRHDHADEGRAADLIPALGGLAGWLAAALAVLWTRRKAL